MFPFGVAVELPRNDFLQGKWSECIQEAVSKRPAYPDSLSKEGDVLAAHYLIKYAETGSFYDATN